MFDSGTYVVPVILVLIWWVIASIALQQAARSRGSRGMGWFILSMLLGPLYTVLLLIAHPAKPIAEDGEFDGGLSITSRRTE